VFDEPINLQTNVAISVHEDSTDNFGTVRPASVGHLLQIRPVCQIVVAFRPANVNALGLWPQLDD